MVILGLDISTSTIGYAFTQNQRILDMGFIDIKKLDTYKRKAFFILEKFDCMLLTRLFVLERLSAIVLLKKLNAMFMQFLVLNSRHKYTKYYCLNQIHYCTQDKSTQ